MTGPLRVCQTVELRPEMRERYLELHAAVWDTVEARLAEAHVENYSIFIRGNTLVGYFEYVGTDLEGDLAGVDADPVVQEWLSLTSACQLDPEPGEPGGPWRDLSLVWHLDREQ